MQVRGYIVTGDFDLEKAIKTSALRMLEVRPSKVGICVPAIENPAYWLLFFTESDLVIITPDKPDEVIESINAERTMIEMAMMASEIQKTAMAAVGEAVRDKPSDLRFTSDKDHERAALIAQIKGAEKFKVGPIPAYDGSPFDKDGNLSVAEDPHEENDRDELDWIGGEDGEV